MQASWCKFVKPTASSCETHRPYSYSKARTYAGEFVGGTPVHFIALGFPAPVILELTSQIAASRREFTEAAAGGGGGGGGGGVRPLALPPSHPRHSQYEDAYIAV